MANSRRRQAASLVLRLRSPGPFIAKLLQFKPAWYIRSPCIPAPPDAAPSAVATHSIRTDAAVAVVPAAVSLLRLARAFHFRVSLICILFFFFSFDLMISGVGLAWRSRVRCRDPTISVTAMVGSEISVPVIGCSDLLTHLSLQQFIFCSYS
jgi:hypothetical protein